MIARPATSPFTRTMRRRECAASREGVKTPSADRDRTGVPIAARSSIARARFLRHAERDVARRRGRRRPRPCRRRDFPACRLPRPPRRCRPAPKRTSRCIRSGVGAKIATGVGASFSAQNTPARPPPTMRMGGEFSRIDAQSTATAASRASAAASRSIAASTRRAGAVGKGRASAAAWPLRRHFAQGLAENVDDLVVVIVPVLFREIRRSNARERQSRRCFRAPATPGLS